MKKLSINLNEDVYAQLLLRKKITGMSINWQINHLLLRQLNKTAESDAKIISDIVEKSHHKQN